MKNEVNLAVSLAELKKQISAEKEKLDYILKGAELLAEMLAAKANKDEPQARREEQYSEPGLETAPGTGQRNAI